jgi:hypothetical protein
VSKPRQPAPPTFSQLWTPATDCQSNGRTRSAYAEASADAGGAVPPQDSGGTLAIGCATAQALQHEGGRGIACSMQRSLYKAQSMPTGPAGGRLCTAAHRSAQTAGTHSCQPRQSHARMRVRTHTRTRAHQARARAHTACERARRPQGFAHAALRCVRLGAGKGRAHKVSANRVSSVPAAPSPNALIRACHARNGGQRQGCRHDTNRHRGALARSRAARTGGRGRGTRTATLRSA